MSTRHKSDSTEQREVEPVMLRRLNRRLHSSLSPESLKLNCGAHVELDGFDKKRRILCEVYAHLGVLKGGQPHKVAHDILKMLLVEKDRGKRPWRKIYCFANEVPQEVRQSGKSWLAHAAIQFDVKFEAVRLPELTVALLKKVQRRQAKSINPRTAG